MKKIILLILILFSFNCSVFPKNIDIEYNDGIYHITLNGEKIKKKIKFISSEHLITNKEAHQKSASKLTINAGFFDPENEKTISYIVTDGQISADPLFNENLLMSGKYTRKSLDMIMNRSEFRVVRCGNKIHYEITPHKAEIEFGCELLTAGQGGPLILPNLRLEEEYFIVKKDGEVVRESASVLHKTARTVIALKDGVAHILIITDENPMDMYEVQALCKKMGFDRAMAFDGGSSTSLNYLDKIEVTSNSDGGGRNLKSFMIISK